VQRRFKLFEEMSRLNGEVCASQRDLLLALARCPALLPTGSSSQRCRIFSVVGEFLQEAATELRGTPDAEAVQHILSWLPRGTLAETTALSDVRTGILRVAALLDVDTLESVLSEQFLPVLLAACPESSETSLRNMVARTVETLRTWATSRS
jgi:hypothetical protein